jgi:drug/metabolite transporter (DMT)-like permease
VLAWYDAPGTGVVSSAFIFGEFISAIRYLGIALILAGVAFTLLPAGRSSPDSVKLEPMR